MATTNKINFIRKELDTLPMPEPGKRGEYWDTKTTGLAVRITPNGVKTFCLVRRVAGKLERVTLGRYPAMTPEQARLRATELNATIAKGASPTADKKRAKLEGKTLREVFEAYIDRHTLKPQTVFDIRRCMNEVYPDWLDKPMAKISGDMVVIRHCQHGAERSEARANLGMRYLRAAFNFAAAEYTTPDGNPIITVNPVKKLSATKAWHRVDRRQTVIKPHELGAWASAVLGLPRADISDYFMTLLLTGMRREEALKLTWANVDMTAKTFTLIDPKNHNDHTLPMSDYLAELFTRRKSVAASGFVFADSHGRKTEHFRCAQATVAAISGVPFTPHDLRRTFATIAESLDIPAYAIKRLLNHVNGSDVTAGYIVANVERLREPMQKITDYILKSAGLKQTAEVIQIKRSR
jgi:integrase